MPPSSPRRRDSPAPVALLGATGWTGRRVAQALARRGTPLLLAGRRPDALAALAADLPGEPPPWRVVDIDGDPAPLAALAAEAGVLLSCAGPFTALGRPVVQAALAGGTHFVDVSGEQPFALACEDLDPTARAAGLAIVHGAGVEVALTDCAAALLAADLDRVHAATVAGAAQGFRPSRGSALSALRIAGETGFWLHDGQRVATPVAAHRDHLDFDPPFGRRPVVAIPGLEVLSLPRHLDLQHIACWIALPAPLALAASLPHRAWPRLARSPLGDLADHGLRHLPWPQVGSTDTRFQLLVQLDGERSGRPTRRRAVVEGGEVYDLTAEIVALVADTLVHAGPRVGRGGILAPSQVIDPARLFAALARLEPPCRLSRTVAPLATG